MDDSEEYHYHVRVETKDGGREIRLGLSASEVNERIIEPYQAGRPIVVAGRTVSVSELSRVRIARSTQTATQLTNRARNEQRQRAREGLLSFTPEDEAAFELAEDITDTVITTPPGGLQVDNEIDGEQSVIDPRKVFVIHGRDAKLRDSMFAFLRSLDLSPIEWSEGVRATGKGSPYVGEVLDSAFGMAQAVVALLSPDDLAELRPALRGSAEPPHETSPTPQARPNVLFEAGMAFGSKPDRTILVEVGVLRPFSDVGGRHVIRLANDSPKRQELAERLRTAGCAVNTTGTDWHTVGDFNPAPT